MCSISQTCPMQKRSCLCSGQPKQLKEVSCSDFCGHLIWWIKWVFNTRNDAYTQITKEGCVWLVLTELSIILEASNDSSFTLVSHKHNHTEDQWLEQVIYWANTVPSNSSSPLILTPFCYILGAEGQFWLINYIWLLKLKVKLCKAFQITVSVQCNSILLLVPCSWSICCNTIYFKML